MGITCSGGHITKLQLDNNNLQGVLTDSMTAFTELEYFWMNDNNVTGKIPQSFATGFPNLNWFEINNNKLYGTVPAFNFKQFDCGYTDDSPGNCCDFQNNNFECPLPSDMNTECSPMNGKTLLPTTCSSSGYSYLPQSTTTGSGAVTSDNTCVACQAGQFKTVSGTEDCQLCPAGYFATSNAAACTACPQSKYSMAAGWGSCTPCYRGTTNTEGSTKCALDIVQRSFAKLDPMFDPCVTSYTATVPTGTDILLVRVTAAASLEIFINGMSTQYFPSIVELRRGHPFSVLFDKALTADIGAGMGGTCMYSNANATWTCWATTAYVEPVDKKFTYPATGDMNIINFWGTEITYLPDSGMFTCYSNCPLLTHNADDDDTIPLTGAKAGVSVGQVTTRLAPSWANLDTNHRVFELQFKEAVVTPEGTIPSGMFGSCVLTHCYEMGGYFFHVTECDSVGIGEAAWACWETTSPTNPNVAALISPAGASPQVNFWGVELTYNEATGAFSDPGGREVAQVLVLHEYAQVLAPDYMPVLVNITSLDVGIANNAQMEASGVRKLAAAAADPATTHTAPALVGPSVGRARKRKLQTSTTTTTAMPVVGNIDIGAGVGVTPGVISRKLAAATAVTTASKQIVSTGESSNPSLRHEHDQLITETLLQSPTIRLASASATTSATTTAVSTRSLASACTTVQGPYQVSVSFDDTKISLIDSLASAASAHSSGAVAAVVVSLSAVLLALAAVVVVLRIRAGNDQLEKLRPTMTMTMDRANNVDSDTSYVAL
jgi:hypothetical protein